MKWVHCMWAEYNNNILSRPYLPRIFFTHAYAAYLTKLSDILRLSIIIKKQVVMIKGRKVVTTTATL